MKVEDGFHTAALSISLSRILSKNAQEEDALISFDF